MDSLPLLIMQNEAMRVYLEHKTKLYALAKLAKLPSVLLAWQI
jgi:hypothetical protein